MSDSRELSVEEAQGPCGDSRHRWRFANPPQYRWNTRQVLAECTNCHGTYWAQLSPEKWQRFLMYLGASRK